MGDRAGRAARREACRENQANVDIRRGVDGGESVSGSSDWEVLKEAVRVFHGNDKTRTMFS